MIFAVSLIPLIGAVGVAVDFARVNETRTALQLAVDNSAVAGAAAAFGTSTQTSASANSPSSVAQSYYSAIPLPGGATDTSAANAVSTSGTLPSPITVSVTSTAVVPTTFLAIWRSQISVSASATAVASGPANVTGAFPFALTKCIYDTYWSNGQPTIDPSTGQPYAITLGSSYHVTNSCTSGQWTSFMTADNSDSNLKSLIDGANTSGSGSLSIGSSIYIVDGTKANLYSETGSVDTGKIVLMPVSSESVMSAGSYTAVYALAPFYVTSAAGGSSKTITGHFVSNYHSPLSGGSGGQYYGAGVVTLTQ